MKRLYPLLFISVLISWGCEDNSDNTTGVTKYLMTLENMDEGFDVIQNELDEFIIVGKKSGTVQDISQGVCVTKVDSDGNEIWSKTYGNNENNQGRGTSIDVVSGGGFIITGYEVQGSNPTLKPFLFKIDSDGNQEWFNSFGITNTIPRSVKGTLDNGIIFISSFDNETGDKDILIRKTNGSGETEWEYIYSINGTYEYGNSIVVSEDGGYVFTGSSSENGGELLIGKINNEGQEQWIKKINNRDLTIGESLSNSSDGGYIVTGWSIYDNVYYGYLLKTDSEGNLEWEKYFDIEFGGEENRCLSVKQTDDNGYVVTGYSRNYSSNFNGKVFLIKFDPNGDEVWRKSINTSGNIDGGNSVIQTSDLGYFVTGMYNGGTLLLKTDSEGNYE